jgi:hypothetical protein
MLVADMVGTEFGSARLASLLDARHQQDRRPAGLSIWEGLAWLDRREATQVRPPLHEGHDRHDDRAGKPARIV